MKHTATGVPWLTASDAAARLGKPSVGAFHTWLSRERKQGTLRLRVHRFGGQLRFRAVDLDRLVEPDPETEAARLLRRVS